jgi:hypothetical protein
LDHAPDFAPRGKGYQSGCAASVECDSGSGRNHRPHHGERSGIISGQRGGCNGWAIVASDQRVLLGDDALNLPSPTGGHPGYRHQLIVQSGPHPPQRRKEVEANSISQMSL